MFCQPVIVQASYQEDCLKTAQKMSSAINALNEMQLLGRIVEEPSQEIIFLDVIVRAMNTDGGLRLGLFPTQDIDPFKYCFLTPSEAEGYGKPYFQQCARIDGGIIGCYAPVQFHGNGKHWCLEYCLMDKP